jgi:hypothetical protein
MTISFESPNYAGRFIRHKNFQLWIDPDDGSDLFKQDASFHPRPRPYNETLVSFESVNFPGYFIRHKNFQLWIDPDDGSDLFKQDASFRQRPGLADGTLVSFESVNFPGYFIRHKNFQLWIDPDDGSDLFKQDASFRQFPGLKTVELENTFRNYPHYYKVQTHVHGKPGADAEQGTDEVERAYHGKEYSFIFLTNHNVVTADPVVGCDDEGRCILHIPAAESGWLCRHHMIVLNPKHWDIVNWADEEEMIAAAGITITGGVIVAGLAASMGGGPAGLASFLVTIGITALTANQIANDFFDRCNDIQGKIARFAKDGALVVMAHPKAKYKLGGPTYSQEDVLKNCGYDGMEIWVGGSDIEDSQVSGADSVSYWDSVLSVGRDRRTWGFASDDCEDLANLNAFNRGWIVVNSSKPMNSVPDQEMRDDIVQNIRHGNFYAVARSPSANPTTHGPADIGPRLEIWTEDCTVHVRADKESTIEFKGALMGSHGSRYENVMEAFYTVDQAKDLYVRIEVQQRRTDEDGNQDTYVAYTQPVYLVGHGGVKGHVRGQCHEKMDDVKVSFRAEYGCVTYETVTDSNENYTISLPRGSYLVEAGGPEPWYERFGGLVGVGNSYTDYDIYFKLKQGLHCP